MKHTPMDDFEYQVVELDGVRYAMLRESLLRQVCLRAGVSLPAQPGARDGAGANPGDPDMDVNRLAGRLVARRKRVRLTQAELASRAGVRVETLNRLERGKTSPDFATVRKLVVAMNEAETAARRMSVRRDAAMLKELTDARNDDARRSR